MSGITNLIKDLRNKTGAGFLDCKNALEANDNNLDKAIEFLRKKGLAKASKKSSREANEGAVSIYSNEKLIILLKVNSETDFAAKSETFLNFLDELGSIALSTNNINLSKQEFLDLNYKGNTVSEFFKNMIAQIGENLILSDLVVMDNEKSKHEYYVHNSYKNNIGKIISVIKYQSNEQNEEVRNFSKNLCMHVAAMKPESIDISDLDNDTINNEKKIQRELILSSGKPENIVDKILEGKMKKFYSEITLMNQKYILDQDKDVKDIIEEFSKFDYKLLSFKIIIL